MAALIPELLLLQILSDPVHNLITFDCRGKFISRTPLVSVKSKILFSTTENIQKKVWTLTPCSLTENPAEGFFLCFEIIMTIQMAFLLMLINAIAELQHKNSSLNGKPLTAWNLRKLEILTRSMSVNINLSLLTSL